MLDDARLLTVTDLKQYAYCPRVVYYERCLPHIRPRTYMMDAGRDAHEDEQDRAARRVIAKYAVPDGQRQFNVRLLSETLGLQGLLDEVMLASDGTTIPVDYKLASSVSANHRIQITAYALLLEANGSLPVERGFIYLIPTRKLVTVNITARLRAITFDLLDKLRTLIALEQMPPPTERSSQCAACEFRRFCNDV